jgi:hypothetical protein
MSVPKRAQTSSRRCQSTLERGRRDIWEPQNKTDVAACGRTQLRRGPFERLLEEAEGVLNGEAGDVRQAR